MSNQIEKIIEALIDERKDQQVIDKPGHVLNGRQFLAALLETDHSPTEIKTMLDVALGD